MVNLQLINCSDGVINRKISQSNEKKMKTTPFFFLITHAATFNFFPDFLKFKEMCAN